MQSSEGPKDVPGKEYIAFEEDRRVARGSLAEVAVAVKKALEGGGRWTALVFDAESSRIVDLVLDGTAEEVARRYERREAARARSEARARARPRLAVVGREVRLLPRHWEWLDGQPGGASVALRKLVEKERREGAGAERLRRARDATYRFLSAMAGDLAGYEEALRALYAGRGEDFTEQIAAWPVDVREHATELAEAAFEDS